MRYLASPAQLRAAFLRWCLVTVPAVLALGFLSGQAAGSGPGNPWFDALAKPAAYPPPEAFGIVWSILYVLMGIALALVLAARGASGRGAALGAFLLQLALNLAWSPLFFGAHQVYAALVLLAVLIVAVVATIWLFWRVRWLAGALLLPYLAWCLFAAYLNYEFHVLNPGAENVRENGAAVHIRL